MEEAIRYEPFWPGDKEGKCRINQQLETKSLKKSVWVQEHFARLEEVGKAAEKGNRVFPTSENTTLARGQRMRKRSIKS